MSLRDLAERLIWTFVSAAGGGLAGVPLFGLEVWQAAGVAGLAAVVNAVTVYARWRLSVLPDPGQGFAP